MFLSRSRRLSRMADKARRRTRRAYAIAAGFFPREYLSGRFPHPTEIVDSDWCGNLIGFVEWGSNAGNVRILSPQRAIDATRSRILSPRALKYHRGDIVPSPIRCYRLSSLPSLCRDSR